MPLNGKRQVKKEPHKWLFLSLSGISPAILIYFNTPSYNPLFKPYLSSIYLETYCYIYYLCMNAISMNEYGLHQILQ